MVPFVPDYLIWEWVVIILLAVIRYGGGITVGHRFNGTLGSFVL